MWGEFGLGEEKKKNKLNVYLYEGKKKKASNTAD